MSDNLTRVNSISPAFYTLDQVATMLGLSTRTVRREIERGKLPTPVRIASRLRIPADQLQACIAKIKRGGR